LGESGLPDAVDDALLAGLKKVIRDTPKGKYSGQSKTG